MIKAILFDFNGVIIDDEPIQLKAYQQALEPLGISLTEEQYYAQMGQDDRGFLDAIFRGVGRELSEAERAGLIDRKSELHHSMIEDELPLFPGVVAFIKSAARHFTLGVVSMARRIEIDDVLERAGLTADFPVIVSAEDARACKPDPDCCIQAFRRMDRYRMENDHNPLTREECLVIEDSPPGVQAGRAAGMRTLGVTNTVDAAALRAAGAEVVTASLFDWTIDSVHRLY